MNDYTKRTEVMNPPASAAQGAEARNLNTVQRHGTGAVPQGMEAQATQPSAAPLFIPLKTEHFEAFKSGAKECEYRPYGTRWNERTCPVGREVVLSKGYGKRERLSGRVAWFNRQSPWYPPGWLAIYGPDPVEVAEIRITLTSGEQS